MPLQGEEYMTLDFRYTKALKGRRSTSYGHRPS